jgi:hypothetical protein
VALGGVLRPSLPRSLRLCASDAITTYVHPDLTMMLPKPPPFNILAIGIQLVKHERPDIKPGWTRPRSIAANNRRSNLSSSRPDASLCIGPAQDWRRNLPPLWYLRWKPFISFLAMRSALRWSAARSCRWRRGLDKEKKEGIKNRKKARKKGNRQLY